MANEVHYDSAEQAADAARQELAPQYTPFGLDPKVYVVEACGLTAVCLPWGHSKRTLAYRGCTKDMSEIQAGVKLMDARFVDTLYWIEGQQQPGRKGAREHAKGLADLGGKYGSLIGAITSACGDIDEKEAASPQGK